MKHFTGKKKHAGVAIVEFVLVLPFFVAFLFMILEFGRAFYTWSVMSEAVREGARKGAIELNSTQAVNVAKTTANNFLAGVSMSNVTVEANMVTVSNPPVNALDVHATFHFQPLLYNSRLKF